MRKLLALAVLVAAGFHVFSRPVATPGAAVQAKAPGGTYYLLSYFSTRSPKGLVGWTPGQEVHLDPSVPAEPDRIGVTDGIYSTSVHRSLLTQDMAQAESLRFADSFAQAQSATVIAEVSAIGNAQQRAQNMAAAHAVEAANAMQVACSTIGAYNSRLRNGAYPATGDSAGYYSFYNLYNLSPGTVSHLSPGVISSTTAPGATSKTPVSMAVNSAVKALAHRTLSTLPVAPAAGLKSFMSHERTILDRINQD